MGLLEHVLEAPERFMDLRLLIDRLPEFIDSLLDPIDIPLLRPAGELIHLIDMPVQFLPELLKGRTDLHSLLHMLFDDIVCLIFISLFKLIERVGQFPAQYIHGITPDH